MKTINKNDSVQNDSVQVNRRIEIFSKLGNLMKHWAANNSWPEHQSGLTKNEYDYFNAVVQNAKNKNAWFTESSVRQALQALSTILNKNDLQNWRQQYPQIKKTQKIGVITAGNIPLVGFHDLLSVLISGHELIIKPASDDADLTKEIVKVLCLLDKDFEQITTVADKQMKDFDAIIATGSNNSARYFEQYFGTYPNIIRKSRTGVALLNGQETEKDLKGLTQDIFAYFGQGCRNVSKLFLPQDYELDHLFNAFYEENQIINHDKYNHNYYYHKAIFLMNQDTITENGFVLLKEDENLFSPLATIFYEYYESTDEVEQKINQHKDDIQVVVGRDHTSFGQTQWPKLNDYADNIDTMQFLTNTSKKI